MAVGRPDSGRISEGAGPAAIGKHVARVVHGRRGRQSFDATLHSDIARYTSPSFSITQ